ncbi:MAG: nuclear transport factor 2 family protein [Acidimicrobiia bacterium]|nr:nuclear transport factor 2 family protein [Acidimicrobiia bacterium]
MAPRLFAVCALLAITSSTAAQGVPASDAARAEPVIAFENAFAQAFQGCDRAAADRMTTKDFTFTDYNGMTYSRAWFLDTVESCARSLVRIEPMHVSLNDGDRAALVISKYHQFVRDEPMPIHQLTHVLVRHDGVWKLAHHHSAVMQSGAGPAEGKAFAQLQGGPSTKQPGGFSPTIARHAGPAGAPEADRVAMEKAAFNAALTYAAAFQNCQTPRVDRLLAANYLISGFNGMTYTRAWMIDGTEECYHDLQRIDPLQLRLYGDNMAILLGRYHQFVYNRPTDLRHLTVVLFREGGAWRVAYHYSTTFNENVGSPDGKLFYSTGGNSTLVDLPFPNSVAPRAP